MKFKINYIKSLILTCLYNFTSVRSKSAYPLLLVISFDGFRYDYLDKVKLPNFSELIRDGVRAQWMDNLFITKTLPNHFSIATGLFQESHGIVGNVMFDPVFNETFDFDNIDSKWWDNGLSWPIWVANQAAGKGRYSGGCLWPGTDVWYRSQKAHYTFMNEDSDWNHRVECVVAWLADPFQPANCVFLYFEEPDIAGHQHGPNSPEVLRQILRADRTLGYLLSLLRLKKLYEELNIIILSDHGMSEVPFENNVEMGAILPLDKVKVIGSTPIWQITPKKNQDIPTIHRLLKKRGSQEPMQVFLRSDIPEEYHYRNHRRVAPILAIAHLNYGLVSRKGPIPNNIFITAPNMEYKKESYMSIIVSNFDNVEMTNRLCGPGGQHGYPAENIEMKPLFVAHGPAFRRGFLAKPFRNIDLYPLMCHILNISVSPNNGSFEMVRHLLADTVSTFCVTARVCPRLFVEVES
ncbi:ENPP4 [Cordylochernes scorpioides]|uniref:ENPP4 n=1 Tax=Cordylochernes scorpioides TaxID=51811 RepID=A0ABY6KZP7_9ARAC|nr:ENPP4 [Cordylochernes scorpioides]